MSSFGSILFHNKNLIEVGPATLRADGKQVRALLRFEKTEYGSTRESDRISIHYKQRMEDEKAYWYSLNTLPAADLRAYGKNTLGFDRVRMVLEPRDRDAVAVWLDEVMARSTTESAKFFIEVGWPTYGSRDELLGTQWKRERTAYHSVAAARAAFKNHPDAGYEDAEFRVVTSAGEEVPHRHTQIYSDDGSLFGLSAGLFNSNRKYYLAGEVWQGKSRMQSASRLTLERFDSSDDSAFFLYRRDGGFIARVHAKTVAAPNKWVSFKKGKYEVRVLRADLLTAVEAIA